MRGVLMGGYVLHPHKHRKPLNSLSTRMLLSALLPGVLRRMHPRGARTLTALPTEDLWKTFKLSIEVRPGRLCGKVEISVILVLQVRDEGYEIVGAPVGQLQMNQYLIACTETKQVVVRVLLSLRSSSR